MVVDMHIRGLVGAVFVSVIWMLFVIKESASALAEGIKYKDNGLSLIAIVFMVVGVVFGMIIFLSLTDFSFRMIGGL